jgi:hypothetical protein
VDVESKWVEPLRLPLAYSLAAVFTFAAFGALLAGFWALIPRSQVPWRELGVWLAAGLATAGGGAIIARLVRSRKVLAAAVFGCALAAPSSLYIVGPSWLVPVIGFISGLTAAAGAVAVQQWKHGDSANPEL